jgi:hypothetical protein
MAGSMPPRAAFDRCAETELARKIAGVQEMVHLGCEKRKMVQAGTGAVEEYDIVRISLALQEDAARSNVPFGAMYSLRRKPAAI